MRFKSDNHAGIALASKNYAIGDTIKDPATLFQLADMKCGVYVKKWKKITSASFILGMPFNSVMHGLWFGQFHMIEKLDEETKDTIPL